MAQKGKVDRIGETVTDSKDKDFLGSPVEGKKKIAGQIRIRAIVSAIPALDPEKDFTRDGKPEVKAIEELLGLDISAEERDAAFKIAQAEKDKKAAGEKTVVTCEDVIADMRSRGIKT